MRLVLYQPDIPQNAGTILRLAACWGIAVDIVEPCGFAWDDRRLRRAGMDYLDQVTLARHRSWAAFLDIREKARAAGVRPGRLILLSTRAATGYQDMRYEENDSLLLGQESAGVPDDVRAQADEGVRIPLRPGMRSLNVALAAAIVAGEAMRQRGFAFS